MLGVVGLVRERRVAQALLHRLRDAVAVELRVDEPARDLLLARQRTARALSSDSLRQRLADLPRRARRRGGSCRGSVRWTWSRKLSSPGAPCGDGRGERLLGVDEADAGLAARHLAHDRVRARVGAEAERVEVAGPLEMAPRVGVPAEARLAAAEAVGRLGVLRVERDGLCSGPRPRPSGPRLRAGRPPRRAPPSARGRPPERRGVQRRERPAAPEVHGHRAEDDRHARARAPARQVSARLPS